MSNEKDIELTDEEMAEMELQEELDEMADEFMEKLTDEEKAEMQALRDAGDSIIRQICNGDEENEEEVASAMSIIGFNLAVIQGRLGLSLDDMKSIINHTFAVNDHAWRMSQKYGPTPADAEEVQ